MTPALERDQALVWAVFHQLEVHSAPLMTRISNTIKKMKKTKIMPTQTKTRWTLSKMRTRTAPTRKMMKTTRSLIINPEVAAHPTYPESRRLLDLVQMRRTTRMAAGFMSLLP